MNRLSIACASLFATSLAASAANAGATADMTFVAPGAGQDVSVTLNGNTINTFAGQIGMLLTNASDITMNGLWLSYCAELTQEFNFNDPGATFQVVSVASLPIPGPAMGAVRADAIARMYEGANGAQYLPDNDYATAFQVAIWEIAYDYDGTGGSIDLFAGDFLATSLSAGVLADIATLFAFAANGQGPMADIIGLGHETYQDQIIEEGGFIPSPGAIALLGMAGLLGSRRRRA